MLGLLLSGIPGEFLYAFLIFPMGVTRPDELISLLSSPQQYLVNNIQHGAPDYSTFSILPLLT
jgi:hypothetical protein